MIAPLNIRWQVAQIGGTARSPPGQCRLSNV